MHALPISGMESEVAGMISATNNMKTVNESSTVMPVNRYKTKRNDCMKHTCNCIMNYTRNKILNVDCSWSMNWSVF